MLNNTIYQPVGDAVTVKRSAQGVVLRNNILWVDLGACISVDSNSQTGFDSDYNLFYLTDEDGVLDVAAPGVLANDSDAEGDALSVVLVSGPSHGVLTFGGDGSFHYEPYADFAGMDRFSYQVSDGVDDGNVVEVVIGVSGVNDGPVARDDEVSTLAGEAVSVDVLINDWDVDGDELSVGDHKLKAAGQVDGQPAEEQTKE